MSAILFITAIQVFLMGLVSEQISALNYKDSNSHFDADATYGSPEVENSAPAEAIKL